MHINFHEEKQKKVVASTHIDIELFAVIEKIAKENNTTISKVIAKILDLYLNKLKI